MAGISIGGLGSGLDTAAIIEALVRVERFPIDALETKKTDDKKKLDLMSTLKGLVDTLKTKAKSLSTPAEFLAFNVTAGNATTASFKAASSAIAGSHTITVNQLASSDRWAFNGVADATTNLALADGEGVSFTYEGVVYNATVTAAASSLNDVAAAINTAATGKVSASVVNSGTTTNPSWQLVLSGHSTGEDLRISGISSSITALTIDATGPSPAGVAQSANNLTVGNNAVALIDGLTVTRSTNDFSDVITGVSISALTADPLTSTTFTVEPDKEAIKTKLKDFVDAFNKVMGFIHDQNTYSEEKGAGGPLFGDSSLRTIERTIRAELFGATATQISGDTAGFGTLKLLGIDLQKDGTLVINDSKLTAKLDADLSKFSDLFVDTDGFDNGGAAIGTPGYYIDNTLDSGLADKLVRAIDRVVKGYTDTAGNTSKGLFDARADAINARIKLYDKQIEDREFRLERFQASMEARFAALERTMAALQSQQQYLTNVSA
ncbi:MAG: flagellar filament capping protein FliD [Planctomycetes bacterium]|nr:flagellar filament capping protein FliD [Planctomycetota bacterium]